MTVSEAEDTAKILANALDQSRKIEAQTWAQLIFWRALAGVSMLANLALLITVLMLLAEEW